MNEWFKRIIFFLLILLLFTISYKYFNYEYLKHNFSYETEKNKIVETRSSNNNLFVNLKLNDTYCAFNKEENTCYFYDDFNDNKIIKTKVYSYDDINYICSNGYNISNIMYTRNQDNFILLYNDKYYYEIRIKFVSIPIINISYMIKDKQIDNNFNSEIGTFNNRSNVQEENFFFQLYDNVKKRIIRDTGSMHIRGATSSTYDKKSYRLELKDKYNLLGMRKDEDWILDALYTDMSKIRNKLSSDIWNLINDSQTVNNDLKSEFVEVFINNSYNGLYVLKEPVDHKTVSISKDGLIVKVVNKVDFDYNKMVNNINYHNDFIISYELKYPKGEYIYWKYFFNRRYPNQSYNVFDIYDVENYINMKIFLALINGKDNDFKNLYLSMHNKNSKIIITPWDMDLTWGLNWYDDDSLHSIFSINDSHNSMWLNAYLFNDTDDYALSLLKNRYWELRKDVITMDTINSYLDNYEKLLIESGATTRDSERWYEYDVKYEIENIREWAKRRIEFLDEYFKK